MSSSIEEEFSPPDWATKEEVIKAAKHYINYWKVEARHAHGQLERLRKEIRDLKKAGTDIIYEREDEGS